MNDKPMLSQLGDPSMTPEQTAAMHAELHAKFGLEAQRKRLDSKFRSPFQAQMLDLADEFFQEMLKANSATPYVHSTYEMFLGKARAALTLFTDGDVKAAYALEQCFHDSNEPMRYYLNKWPLEELKEDYAGTAGEMRLAFQKRGF